jgi:hypothetical protein
MPPGWDRIPRLTFARGAGSNGHEEVGDRGPADRNAEHIRRNALVCVEPWRSRLPVVQDAGSGSLAHG